MMRSTSILTARVPHAVATRVRAAAAASGRATNRYLADLIIAVVGRAREYDSITKDMAERLAKEHGIDQLACLLTERAEAYENVSIRESETQDSTPTP